MLAAEMEAKMVLFDVAEQVLAATGLKPCAVRFVLHLCILHKVPARSVWVSRAHRASLRFASLAPLLRVGLHVAQPWDGMSTAAAASRSQMLPSCALVCLLRPLPEEHVKPDPNKMHSFWSCRLTS